VTASGKRAALLLVPTAIAVAAGLVALRLHFQPPTVPTYVVKEASDTEVALQAGDRFEIAAQPTAPVQGAIAARGFLIRGDEVRAWDPPFSVATDGSVRISGPVDALFRGVPPGAWEVAVAVGRPELLPTAPRDVLSRRADDGGPAGWRLVRERVRLGG
jgi:hypothetical protein